MLAPRHPPLWRQFNTLDALFAGAALALMLFVPLVEIGLRPLLGKGIDNAPVLVQHLGLILAMAGALVAERTGHLSSLGAVWPPPANPCCAPLPPSLPMPARPCSAAHWRKPAGRSSPAKWRRHARSPMASPAG